MILKSVSLNNIRSYIDQTIDFNQGIVVLSGDIGAGKSTILLAIEFALFGIYDSGNSLLRKGAAEGSVALTFEIHNHTYTVKRFLKRKPEGIRQTNGYLIINDTKKDLTPIELKQHIISLLGYPQESLTKRSLIYRYTTYTPQDEMKQILYEDAEERINTIRTIFGVDKYQRILENTEIFGKNLRENKKELLGKVSDLETKKNELKKIHQEKEELLKKEKELDKELVDSKNVLAEIKKKLSVLESDLKKSHEIHREKAAIDAALKHKEYQQRMLEKELTKLNQELTLLKEKATPQKLSELKNKLKTGIKEEIAALEKEQLILQRHLGELDATKNASEKIKKQISELNDCPLCLQSVPHAHKENIKNKEHEKIKDIDNNLTEISKKIESVKQMLIEKNNNLQASVAAEKEISLLQLYIKNAAEKEVTIQEKMELQQMLSAEIKELKHKNDSLQQISIENKEKEYEEIKTEFERAQLSERAVELEKTRITTEIKNSEKMMLMLTKEIDEKEKSKAALHEISLMEHWLQNNFSKIISLMERHILSNIYTAFNDNFKELFEILIEDEQLVAKIDERFSPFIEQNGYETEFENLSGGEKTSICLAYRLALHKAINNILPRTQGRGLLMLDEPTDGFSNEQIDKMKDIFEKLHTQQAIIVSHEHKIESIADHVIQITKTGHTSRIFI